MKLINQLSEKMKSIGGRLDEYEAFFCLDAPAGYVWKATGSAAITIQWASRSQSWLTQAIKDEMPNIKMGLEKLTDAKRLAELQWELGDDNWVAPEGSPEVIAWP